MNEFVGPPLPLGVVKSWSYMLKTFQNIDSMVVICKILRNNDLLDRLSKNAHDKGSLPQFRCIFSHWGIRVCDGAHWRL